MIEAAPLVNFFISILDNGYCVLTTINGQIIQIRKLQLSKIKYFIFKQFSFDFNQSFCSLNEENCYSICRQL